MRKSCKTGRSVTLQLPSPSISGDQVKRITPNVTPPEYKAQLSGCLARRVDLFLKEVSSLYPQAEDLTISDIERKVQNT